MRTSAPPTSGTGGRSARLPRDLHPVAWWVWALGLAAAATRTTNPWLLLLIVLVASVTVVARRGDAPWALSFRLYLALGAVVVLVRVVFRILFGGGYGEHVILGLPVVPLPDWAAGVTLLGPVTIDSVLAGAYDGLRLATVIICVERPTRSPTLAVCSVPCPPRSTRWGPRSSSRSRSSPSSPRACNGCDGPGVCAVRRARASVRCAASSSPSWRTRWRGPSRGSEHGRARVRPVGQRKPGSSSPSHHGASLLLGLVGLVVGAYAYLDSTAPRGLAWPMLLVGVTLAGLGFLGAGRGVTRTRYRPPHWGLADVGVALTGVVVAVLMTVAARDLMVVLPNPATVPPMSPLALLAVLVGVLPAFIAPPPVLTADAVEVAVDTHEPGVRHMLEWRDVSVHYDQDAPPVLTDVCLRVEEAELVLVAGRTGSGKSTLLRTLNGLVPRFTGGVLTGEVIVGDRRVRDVGPRELADLVGFVGQDPAQTFVTEMVEDELAYGMEQLGLSPSTMRRRVEETLDLLGIAELRRRPVRTLSGGQQQRVAIGAVLTMHPQAVVLDEPTSALDPTAAEEVLGTLARLVDDLGLTVLVAEHRMERVVPFADRLVLVEDGHVRAGDPAELLETSAVAPRGGARPSRGLAAAAADGPRRPASLPHLPRGASRTTERGWGEHARGRLPGSAARTRAAGTRPRGDLRPHGGGARGVDRRARGLGHRPHGPQRVGQVVAALGAAGDRAASERVGGGRRRRSRDDRAARAARGAGPADGHGPALPGDRRGGVRDRRPAGRSRPRHLPHPPGRARHRRARRPAPPRPLRGAAALPGARARAHRPSAGHRARRAERGLDYEAKAHLARIVRRLAGEGHAVLAASHDVEFVAQVADEVVVLAGGEIVSAGPTATVLAESPAFAPQTTKILGDGWLTVDQVREVVA